MRLQADKVRDTLDQIQRVSEGRLDTAIANARLSVDEMRESLIVARYDAAETLGPKITEAQANLRAAYAPVASALDTQCSRHEPAHHRTEGDAMSVSFVLEALVVVGSHRHGDPGRGGGGRALGWPRHVRPGVHLRRGTRRAAGRRRRDHPRGRHDRRPDAGRGRHRLDGRDGGRIIEKRPKQITLIAPLTAFLFCMGSGTGNIIYPLLPVIYDVSYKNRIRPSRPLTVTVVQSGIALAASPSRRRWPRCSP